MTNREVFNRLRGNVDKDVFEISAWKKSCTNAVGINIQIDMAHIGTLMVLIDQEVKRAE